MERCRDLPLPSRIELIFLATRALCSKDLISEGAKPMEHGVERTRIAEVKKTHTRALSCKKTFREIHLSYPYSPRLASPPLPSVVGFGIISPTLIRYIFLAYISIISFCQKGEDPSLINSPLVAKDCGKLPFPMNGSVFGSQTTFPNKLQFSCDNGFDLIGSTVRRCEADGMWSGQQTACQGKRNDNILSSFG